MFKENSRASQVLSNGQDLTLARIASSKLMREIGGWPRLSISPFFASLCTVR